MLGEMFYMPVIVRVVNGDPASRGVDPGFHGCPESGPFLDHVIGDQPKDTVLCEDSLVVIDRFVFEHNMQVADDAVTLGCLLQITGTNLVATFVKKHDESARNSFDISH